MIAREDSAPQPLFGLVLPFRPISLQGAGRLKYQVRLKEHALIAFAGREPLRGKLYVRVIYFHRVMRKKADVDNIIKPILDALKGVVFADDSAIRQCYAESIYIPDGFVLGESKEASPIFDELLRLVGDERIEHFMYIEVGIAPEQTFSFGSMGG
jgi:hypothetical protein